MDTSELGCAGWLFWFQMLFVRKHIASIYRYILKESKSRLLDYGSCTWYFMDLITKKNPMSHGLWWSFWLWPGDLSCSVEKYCGELLIRIHVDTDMIYYFTFCFWVFLVFKDRPGACWAQPHGDSTPPQSSLLQCLLAHPQLLFYLHK